MKNNKTNKFLYDRFTIVTDWENYSVDTYKGIDFYVANSIKSGIDQMYNLSSKKIAPLPICVDMKKIADDTYIFENHGSSRNMIGGVNGNVIVSDTTIDVFFKIDNRHKLKKFDYRYEIENLLSGERILKVIDQTDKNNKKIIECFMLTSNQSLENVSEKVFSYKFNTLFSAK